MILPTYHAVSTTATTAASSASGRGGNRHHQHSDSNSHEYNNNNITRKASGRPASPTKNRNSAANIATNNKIPASSSSSSTSTLSSKQSSSLAIMKKKTASRKIIGSYRRTKRGGDFYDTWKGRVSVHMKVKYFDLKLLVKNVLQKSSLFHEEGWEIIEFYDVIRLSLPAVSSSVVVTATAAMEPAAYFFQHTSASTTSTSTANTSAATSFNGVATDTTPIASTRPPSYCYSSPATEGFVHANDIPPLAPSHLSPTPSNRIPTTSTTMPAINESQQFSPSQGLPIVDLLDDKKEEEEMISLTQKLGPEKQQLLTNNTSSSSSSPPTAAATTTGATNLEEEGASTPEIYIFSFGAIVFWNFQNEESEESWMKKYIFAYHEEQQQQQEEGGEGQESEDDENNAIGDENHVDAIESANDEISFMYGTNYLIKSDVVTLQTREYGEKMALSFALAKSAMLSIFEWSLNQVIERNSSIPEQMVKYGRIPMNSKELSKEIGRIYLVKSGIHLENNVLDTPEEFWEDDKFHGEYEKAMKYFDIMSRLELVNTRLEVMNDMNQILMDAAQNHHARVLEWAVIALIVVEILVEVFRTYRDIF